MTNAKRYREAYGISADEMAKALGISRPTYMSRENGASEFTREEMNKFVETIKSKLTETLPVNIESIFFN